MLHFPEWKKCHFYFYCERGIKTLITWLTGSKWKPNPSAYASYPRIFLWAACKNCELQSFSPWIVRWQWLADFIPSKSEWIAQRILQVMWRRNSNPHSNTFLMIRRRLDTGHHKKEKQLITCRKASRRSPTASPAALNAFLRSCHPDLRQSRLKLQRFQQSEMKAGIGILNFGRDMEGTGKFQEGSGRFHCGAGSETH